MISLVIHGGAWDIPDDLVAAHREGIRKALNDGWDVLKRGGSAVEAVERAIVLMENDETFNAGRGSYLNAAGHVELDASIMAGKTLKAGAVAAVQNSLNPVTLARKIMEESSEILLVGMGAIRFAHEHHVKTCSQDDLITARQLERWREAQGAQERKPGRGANKRRHVPADTVGAVALDRFGDIAAGTSTGGLPGKSPGRVGDAPLIGCATYADNTVGGVATTGAGESIIRVVLAKSVIDLMERREGDPQRAAKEGMDMLARRAQGYGGVIALSRDGRIGVAYNTSRMARGSMTSEMKVPAIAV